MLGAGTCLRAIRDEELYREMWLTSFSAYLRVRWQMSDEEAAWIMDATEGSQRILRFVREYQGTKPVQAVEGDPPKE